MVFFDYKNCVFFIFYFFGRNIDLLVMVFLECSREIFCVCDLYWGGGVILEI